MLRLQLALMDWPDSVAEDDRYQTEPDTGELIPIDLSKKQMRKDYFLTPAAYFRLENFLKAMGHEVMTDKAGNKDYETPVTALIGCKVVVEVQRIMNRDKTEFINVVGELLPPSK
jgi:hypothetical protein